MLHRTRPFFALLISTILLGTPALALAKGGGGGGGGGHSGGGGGGGGRGGGGGGHSGGGGGGGARFSGGGNYGRHWGGFAPGYGRGYGGGYYGHGWGRGYGWGGYPYYGYGLGLGVGLGVGYGLSGGYGYGGYGYPAYGYGGYGYGYTGNGYYPYDAYGTSSSGYYASPDSTYNGTPPDPNATGSAPTPPLPKAEKRMSAGTREFVERGERAFKEGDYEGAVYAWRHAIVDDPQDGLLAMMLGQALFATGRYAEAAGATQAAMRDLPKEQWGVVVIHYTRLYGTVRDYTDQLRALEKAMKAKRGDPALHFLTGFQYAYLGFVEQALDQLDQAVRLAPRDEMAIQLRDMMRAKVVKPAAIPPLPGIPPAPALLPTPIAE